MQQPPAYLSHGPMKYKLQTRIGNWCEEWELEQLKYNFFIIGKMSTSKTCSTETSKHKCSKNS